MDASGNPGYVIANILAANSNAISKRKRIYLGIGLKDGNDFSKLDKDAGTDSWEFFHGMMNSHFSGTGDNLLAINKLVTTLKILDLTTCADEIEIKCLGKKPKQSSSNSSLQNTVGCSPQVLDPLDKVINDKQIRDTSFILAKNSDAVINKASVGSMLLENEGKLEAVGSQYGNTPNDFFRHALNGYRERLGKKASLRGMFQILEECSLGFVISEVEDKLAVKYTSSDE